VPLRQSLHLGAVGNTGKIPAQAPDFATGYGTGVASLPMETIKTGWLSERARDLAQRRQDEMEFGTIEAAQVLPNRERGAYDELAEAVIATAGTGKAIHVTGIDESTLTKRCLPAVRRMVGAKLDRRVTVGIAKDADGNDLDGVAICLGGAIDHDSNVGRPKGSTNKTDAKPKTAAKK